MAWIRVVPEEHAVGPVADAYATAGGARGRVANILNVHSVRPDVLRAHLRLYTDIMFQPSELTRAERELMAVAVSAANGCHY